MSASTMRGLDGSFSALGRLSGNRRLLDLELSALEEDPANPRQFFDPAALEELAASIRSSGVIEPLIVSPLGHGRFVIKAGARRFRAARMAAIERVPCVTVDPDVNLRAVQLIENLQREDLTAWEVATALKETYGLPQRGDAVRIAKELGKSEAWVSRHFALLALPSELRAFAQLNPPAMPITKLLALAGLDATSRHAELEALQVGDARTLSQAPQIVPAQPAMETLTSDAAPAGDDVGPMDPKSPIDIALPENVREAFDAVARRLGVRSKLKSLRKGYAVTLFLQEPELLDLRDRVAHLPPTEAELRVRAAACVAEFSDEITRRLNGGETPLTIATWLKSEKHYDGPVSVLVRLLRPATGKSKRKG